MSRIPAAMVFVDGENLTFRYQAMLAEGFRAQGVVTHVEDVLVWSPFLTKTLLMDIKRVNYYTSVVGDDLKVAETNERLSAIEWESKVYTVDGTSYIGRLVPHVFKKPARSNKSRQVDINITIDMMRHAADSNLDFLVLISGDGDFIPLIQEVMRFGKQVAVGALSSGRAPGLHYCSDDFVDVDQGFFLPAPVKEG